MRISKIGRRPNVIGLPGETGSTYNSYSWTALRSTGIFSCHVARASRRRGVGIPPLCSGQALPAHLGTSRERDAPATAGKMPALRDTLLGVPVGILHSD
jgi:hypothetical protein